MLLKLPYLKDSRGFTLIEAIIVMSIIGIVSGLGLPTLQKSIAKAELKNSANQLKADIRYARQLAISEEQTKYLLFGLDGSLNSNKYVIANDSLNDDNIKTVHLPQGISLAWTNLSQQRIIFGIKGWPAHFGGTLILENKNNEKIYVILASTGRVRVASVPPPSWSE